MIYIGILVPAEPSQVRWFVIDQKRRVRPLDRPDADWQAVHVVYAPRGRQSDLYKPI